MRKEYPIQRLLQPGGQVGMVMSWLWTATAWDGASHTEHLETNTFDEYTPLVCVWSKHFAELKCCTVPADVWLDLPLGHRHHGYGRGRGEPVGFVVAAGVVADLVGGAVEEGDGAEAGEARPGLTWRRREEREEVLHRRIKDRSSIGIKASPYRGPGCEPSPVPQRTAGCIRPTAWPCPEDTWGPGSSGCASPECSQCWNRGRRTQERRDDRLYRADLETRTEGKLDRCCKCWILIVCLYLTSSSTSVVPGN